MPEVEFTNTNGVREYFGGVSKMWVNRRVHNDARFPKPIYFGSKAPRWRIADLKAYAAACEADSKKTAA